MQESNRRASPCIADPNGGNVTPGLIFGLAIIAIGVLFLLDNFGFPVGFVWHYWPVILIAIGLSKLVDSRDTPGRTGGAIIHLLCHGGGGLVVRRYIHHDDSGHLLAQGPRRGDRGQSGLAVFLDVRGAELFPGQCPDLRDLLCPGAGRY